jgi:hypothetical protein
MAVAVELTESFDPNKHQRALDQVFERALALEGVSRVVGPDGFEALGIPSYEDDPHMLGHYIIFGDLDTRVEINENNESTRRTAITAPINAHDYIPGDDHLTPVFLVTGNGIRSGIRLDRIHLLDIAPTIAYLLDLQMSNLSGRVLSEALLDPP